MPAPVEWFGDAPERFSTGISRGISLALWRLDHAGEMEFETAPEPHTHMICAHLSGSIDWAARLDDRAYERPCLPATFCIARAGEAASVRLRNAHASFVHFYLPTGWFEERLEEFSPKMRPSALELLDPMNARSAAVDRCARAAALALRSSGPAARLEIEAAGLTLAGVLIRDHSNADHRIAKTGGLAPWQVARVRELLAENIDTEMSLQTLAAQVGLSPFHFARAFKISTGLPPHRYQMALRIQRAKELLATTDLPISSVAAAVGYEDQGYLARLLRREIGVTPARYRRERRG
jgi:AraC family transcriptional regulator